MKIVLLIRNLNVMGGTHKQLLRLCQFLQKKEVDFTVCTDYYAPDKTYPGFKDIPVEAFYGAERTSHNGAGISDKLHRKLDRIREIMWIMKKVRRADIVNIHDMGYELESALLKKQLHKNLVWQINDLPSCFRVGNMKDADYEEWFEKLKKRTVKAAACTDQITVNVTKNADRVKEHLHQDAKVFYCGVDTNDQLKKHSFPKDKAEFRILSSGVFFPYRNYETQVKVISKLRKNGVPIRLDIIGNTKFSPDYAGMIQNMITEEGLEDYIKIWGQVDERVYTDLHDKADLFTFVNIDQSWGLAVFEAMSCGLPVLVSNSVGATEILHDDVDAVFVDPVNVDEIADRIKALLTDEAYYTRISQNAAEATPKFTWDNMYSSKMLELFEKIIQEKNV